MHRSETRFFLSVGYDRHVDETYYLSSTFEKAKERCREFMSYDGYERYGEIVEVNITKHSWMTASQKEFHYVLEFDPPDDAPRAWINVVYLDKEN